MKRFKFYKAIVPGMSIKESVEMDTNFYYFIMILAMMLLAAIAGARINDMRYNPGSLFEIIWMILFLILMKLLFSFSIFKPYAFYRVGFFCIGLAILHLIMLGIIFLTTTVTLQERGTLVVVAELIAVLLIMIVGVFFILKGRRKDTIRTEYHREKEGLVKA